MAYRLRQFYSDCRKTLIKNPDATRRKQVCDHLKRLVENPLEVEAELGVDQRPGRYVGFHDDKTDTYVLLHVSRGGARIPPHYHGEAWMVYGMAKESSEIKEWCRLDEGSASGVTKTR